MVVNKMYEKLELRKLNIFNYGFVMKKLTQVFLTMTAGWALP